MKEDSVRVTLGGRTDDIIEYERAFRDSFIGNYIALGFSHDYFMVSIW